MRLKMRVTHSMTNIFQINYYRVKIKIPIYNEEDNQHLYSSMIKVNDQKRKWPQETALRNAAR